MVLQQVAMNLIINSIEAMKESAGIRETIITSQRAENEQILVSVGDTGKGLLPQLAEQVFDPFFTTKTHGTGMGLRISRVAWRVLTGRPRHGAGGHVSVYTARCGCGL